MNITDIYIHLQYFIDNAPNTIEDNAKKELCQTIIDYGIPYEIIAVTTIQVDTNITGEFSPNVVCQFDPQITRKWLNIKGDTLAFPFVPGV